MNTYRSLAACLFIAAIVATGAPCAGQVVVNGKDLNQDNELQYIQLMYYIEKGGLKPVFYVDYGFIEPEYNDILEPEQPGYQKISINGESLTDRITVVGVLNRMDQAGWEYLGDVVFIPLKVMNNWHVFTLKRKGEQSGT